MWRWRVAVPIQLNADLQAHCDSLCFLPFYLFVLHFYCAYIMSGNSIKVVCRFRPQNALENREGGTPIIDIGDDGTQVALKVNSISSSFFLNPHSKCSHWTGQRLSRQLYVWQGLWHEHSSTRCFPIFHQEHRRRYESHLIVQAHDSIISWRAFSCL